jgi:hypothetical protein
MSGILNSVIFIDGVQYFIDSSQMVKRVFCFDGAKWILSSIIAEQSTAPSTAEYKWWLDTSSTPPKFKYFDGSIWNIVNMI